MEWFRMWHGVSNDPKIRLCAKTAGVPPVVALGVWASLLEYASENEDRGSLEGLDREVVADMLGLGDELDRLIDAFTSRGMIVEGRIHQWEKRQPSREDDSRKRVSEFRKRRRSNGNADVTQCNADVTQCNAEEGSVTHGNAPDTDTDTDTDTDNNPPLPPLGGDGPTNLSKICREAREALRKVSFSATDLEILKSWDADYTLEEISDACARAKEKGAGRVNYIDQILREDRDRKAREKQDFKPDPLEELYRKTLEAHRA